MVASETGDRYHWYDLVLLPLDTTKGTGPRWPDRSPLDWHRRGLRYRCVEDAPLQKATTVVVARRRNWRSYSRIEKRYGLSEHTHFFPSSPIYLRLFRCSFVFFDALSGRVRLDGSLIR